MEGTAQLAVGAGSTAAVAGTEPAAEALLQQVRIAQRRLGFGTTPGTPQHVGGAPLEPGGGVVAASSLIDTGFGFGYFRVQHVGATSWYLMAAALRQSDAVRRLGMTVTGPVIVASRHSARPVRVTSPGVRRPRPHRMSPVPRREPGRFLGAAWFRYAVALLAGVLTGLSWQPYGLWPLLLIGIPAFTLVVRGVRPPPSAFGLGYVYGLAMLGISISWIHVLGSLDRRPADRVRGAVLRPARARPQPGVGAALVAAGRGVLLGR